MKERDNSTHKIHISINFILSISLLIKIETLRFSDKHNNALFNL